MKFSPDYLREQLGAQPAAGWQVAYSGGLDSTVLLHAMAMLRTQLDVPVGAVHVHHGLQAEADAWESLCRSFCEQLAIPLTVLRVDARAGAGESPEAVARQARYAALADWLAQGHCLLTAQHRDDQAETLLLQLLRGGGVHGLASMPLCTRLGNGTHLRPLLNTGRAQLREYAESEGLRWIDDPSNADPALDRNFLRHRVMPLLRTRWPALAANLSRSAAHAAESAGLLDELARSDLDMAGGQLPATLSLAAVNALAPARRRNVLRHWMKQHAGQPPSAAVLARVEADVLHSRVDAEPRVCWGEHAVCRYRDDLYVLRQEETTVAVGPRIWQLAEPLALPGDGGILTATPAIGQGLRRAAVHAGGVQVRWREGGETCRPAGRDHHHALKKLFQEAGIPPWLRRRIPLLYIEDRLAAVAGLWICEPFQAGPREEGYRIDWHDGQM